MWSWLSSMWSSVFGRISDTIRNWVIDVINGVYGYYHFIDTLIRDAWHDVAVTSYWLWRNLDGIARSIYIRLWQIIRQAIPAIINEYRALYRDAINLGTWVYNTLRTAVDDAIRFAQSVYNSAINWVIQNVWNPLYNSLLTAFKWITERGETLWYYITHPDALVSLIFDALIALLEREAWSVADRLGKFFAALIVKNLTQFVILIEDILDAIL